MAKALLFDLDGTLIDSAADLAQSANAARATCGLDPLSRAEIQSYIGDGARNLVLRSLGGDPAHLDRGLQAFRAHYTEHALDTTTFYPGILDLLNQLQGHALAVVSNKPERFCRKILEGLGQLHRFQAIIGGDTCSEPKPSRAPLDRALHLLSTPPLDALMIGDGPQDVEAAFAASIPSIAITWGFHTQTALASSHPNYFAHSPKHLQTLILSL